MLRICGLAGFTGSVTAERELSIPSDSEIHVHLMQQFTSSLVIVYDEDFDDAPSIGIIVSPPLVVEPPVLLELFASLGITRNQRNLLSVFSGLIASPSAIN